MRVRYFPGPGLVRCEGTGQPAVVVPGIAGRQLRGCRVCHAAIQLRDDGTPRMHYLSVDDLLLMRLAVEDADHEG